MTKKSKENLFRNSLTTSIKTSLFLETGIIAETLTLFSTGSKPFFLYKVLADGLLTMERAVGASVRLAALLNDIFGPNEGENVVAFSKKASEQSGIARKFFIKFPK